MRPPGLPKTGGRQRGTPNKATVDVAEKLAALGCDPLKILASLAWIPKTQGSSDESAPPI